MQDQRRANASHLLLAFSKGVPGGKISKIINDFMLLVFIKDDDLS
jgi:hypothetical protein